MNILPRYDPYRLRVRHVDLDEGIYIIFLMDFQATACCWCLWTSMGEGYFILIDNDTSL